MLDRVELVNFKAFREEVVPLGNLTLLAGLNSTGKSTVMQALALLRQSYVSGALVDDEQAGLLLNGDLVGLGTGRDVRHENYAHAGPGGEGIVIGLHEGGGEYRWNARYERESDLLELDSGPVEHAELSSLAPFGKGFQYLRADRIFPSVRYPRSHDVAIRRGFLGAQGEHTVNYLRYHQDDIVEDESLRHPRANSTTLLAQTEAWMREFCPGVNLEAEEITDTDSVRLGFRFGTAGLSSSNRHRPTNVGFGLTYTLPIVVACLTAGSGGLVLLENPEAHLHPRGQTRIAFLACRAAAAGSQLIVETHSDHILNGVRLAVKRDKIPASAVRMHYFRREGDGVEFVSPVVGEDGMLSQWPEGFFDEWDESLDALLD
ncbi:MULTISPECIES: DUF3696 domain-containing protein [unclassified Actinopolyspora]|uniref:DUF3696 domain-containing protein n=1 Tax=unclassified Actinopolyspora TaxID=2639451 RepID=UPI0013F64152|nr:MULTISPECIES: DUF3696 domain-containing protein [unclassified Actinopolyspora]NHD19021.1 DUF3696 domain-containing protein [Actinopolyspora sp. BKK2]NHE78194.1 DUF3696 domain-containing protein [Actinopolyspora sp. BKK1]